MNNLNHRHPSSTKIEHRCYKRRRQVEITTPTSITHAVQDKAVNSPAFYNPILACRSRPNAETSVENKTMIDTLKIRHETKCYAHEKMIVFVISAPYLILSLEAWIQVGKG